MIRRIPLRPSDVNPTCCTILVSVIILMQSLQSPEILESTLVHICARSALLSICQPNGSSLMMSLPLHSKQELHRTRWSMFRASLTAMARSFSALPWTPSMGLTCPSYPLSFPFKVAMAGRATGRTSMGFATGVYLRRRKERKGEEGKHNQHQRKPRGTKRRGGDHPRTPQPPNTGLPRHRWRCRSWASVRSTSPQEKETPETKTDSWAQHNRQAPSTSCDIEALNATMTKGSNGPNCPRSHLQDRKSGEVWANAQRADPSQYSTINDSSSPPLTARNYPTTELDPPANNFFSPLLAALSEKWEVDH